MNPVGPVRYARWDGGRIHIVKGIFSAWPYILEPDELEAALDWYDESTVALIERAAVNWIWVTWSVGFPLPEEAGQQRELAAYIATCHERGIRVTAYMSLVNAFPDAWRRHGQPIDAWLQRDAQGRPIPYGAVRYAGAPSRFLVCLRQPEWQAYLHEQVSAAVGAGVDGILYDNVGTGCQCPRCGDAFRIHARTVAGRTYGELPDFGHAAVGIVDKVQRVVGVEPTGPRPDEQSTWLWRRFVDTSLAECFAQLADAAHALRPEVLVYANHNVDMGTLAYPAAQVVSTEDAREPGLAADGTRVQNGGLLRAVVASSDGWRATRAEYGVGHGRGAIDDVGNNRFIPMAPRAQQRSIAEAAMHGVSAEINPEGYLKGGLSRGEAWALESWQAIERYHRFLAAHPELFVGTGSTASTAVVVPDRWPDDDPLRVRLLTALAADGLDFEVVLDRQLSVERLARYRLILVADVPVIDGDAARILAATAEAGATVLATPASGRFTATLERAAVDLLARVPSVGAAPPVEDSFQLGRTLAALADAPWQVSSSSPVVHVVRRRDDWLLLHLLNLDEKPIPSIELVGFPGSPTVHSPDASVPAVVSSERGLTVTELDLYAVLAFGSGLPG